MPLSWVLQVVLILPVTAEVFLVLALTVVVALEGSALSSLASGEPGGDEAGVELVMTGIERELAERGRRRRAVLRVRTDQPQAGLALWSSGGRVSHVQARKGVFWLTGLAVSPILRQSQSESYGPFAPGLT